MNFDLGPLTLISTLLINIAVVIKIFHRENAYVISNVKEINNKNKNSSNNNNKNNNDNNNNNNNNNNNKITSWRQNLVKWQVALTMKIFFNS